MAVCWEPTDLTGPMLRSDRWGPMDHWGRIAAAYCCALCLPGAGVGDTCSGADGGVLGADGPDGPDAPFGPLGPDGPLGPNRCCVLLCALLTGCRSRRHLLWSRWRCAGSRRT